MSCDSFQDDIGRLIAGTAEAGVQAAFEVHLAVCADCRAARAAEMQLRPAFAATREIRPSRGLQAALLAVPRRERRTRALVPLALPVALLICGCGTLAGWLMMPGGGPANVAQDRATPAQGGTSPASTDAAVGPGGVSSDASRTPLAGMLAGDVNPADPPALGALPAGPAPTPGARAYAAVGVATQIAMGSEPVIPGPGSRGRRREDRARSTPGATPTDLAALTDGPSAARSASPTTPTAPGIEPGPGATVDPSATPAGALPPAVETATAAPASPSPSRSVATVTRTPTPMVRATQTPRATTQPPPTQPMPTAGPTTASTPAAPGTPIPTSAPAATPTAATTAPAAPTASPSATPTASPTATPTPSPTPSPTP